MSLTAPPLAKPSRAEELKTLAAKVRSQNRAIIRELHAEEVSGGIALRGFAYCYYGKQIAQHEIARRSRMPIVSNAIEVG